jgi:hypothetical protein
MISVGSMLHFKNHNGPWETAVVLRSYMCENKSCCDGDSLWGDDYFRSREVVDILWNTGQIDTDYHLEGLTHDQVEVIAQ